jgi:hypothetical protein
MSPTPAKRILVVWDPSRHSADAFRSLISETVGRPAEVDLVAANPPRRLLSSFALSTGLLPEVLEAEELSDLEKRMREFVARLPRNLGIRSRIQAGDPDQVAAALLKRDSYDLAIVVDSFRVPFRRRVCSRRLAGLADLVLVSAGTAEFPPPVSA